MHKLPNKVNSENPDRPVNDISATSQPNKRRKADDAAMATSTHCTATTNRTGSEISRSLFQSTDNQSGQDSNVWVDTDSLDIRDRNPPVAVSESTGTTSAAAANPGRPHPVSTDRPNRLRHRPARFLQTVQARRLIHRNYASHACYRLASSDVSMTGCSQLVSWREKWLSHVYHVAVV